MGEFTEIRISGLRGFSSLQTLKLAVPTGTPGSGLTVIVGPNNSGKSTIYEAFRALSQNQPPSFTEGKRNKAAGDRIQITLAVADGRTGGLLTSQAGGSETVYSNGGLEPTTFKFVTVPSRRTFSPFFGKDKSTRANYINSSQLSATRGAELGGFAGRMFQVQENPVAFNRLLNQILGYTPSWNIDQSDNGNYYLKFNFDGAFHNSDGLGEGLLSVFVIGDALYDSTEGDLIFVDEPELSLHPSLQRRILDTIVEYAKARQIILSTHSPYFVDWKSLTNGGEIARTVRRGNGIEIKQLQRATIDDLTPIVQNNLYNPHVGGLDAREVFFLEDGIILVEGQEDVVYFERILALLERTIPVPFYGWGVGGADNIAKVTRMLSDLGFSKVICILDNNKSHEIPKLSGSYPNYYFVSISTDDIRDKPAVKAKAAVEGMVSTDGKTLKVGAEKELKILFDRIDAFLDPVRSNKSSSTAAAASGQESDGELQAR